MRGMALVSFGNFDFNTESHELRRNGEGVKLQSQPAQVLRLLLEARGELVTREALRNAIWADGTIVDFDRNINFCISQIRSALGDSADSPRFIRTLPKRGYQFIAPMRSAEPEAGASPADPPPAHPVPSQTPLNRRSIAVASVSAVAAGAALLYGLWKPGIEDQRIAVARFDNETGDSKLDRLVDSLTDLLTAELAAALPPPFAVIGNASILRGPREHRDISQIATALRARYVILGQLQQAGPALQVLAHLIRMPEQTHVSVGRFAPALDNPGVTARGIVEKFKGRLTSLGK